MPEDLKTFFSIDFSIPVRKRKNGVYEARYRAHGLNIYVSAVDFDKLKSKFLRALVDYKDKTETALQEHKEVAQGKNQAHRFMDIAERWLALKRASIKATTLKDYISVLNAHIYPKFVFCGIADIKQSQVQELINNFIEQSKYRTATKIYQTLKSIFDFAVGDDLIERSPMRLLKPPKYEKQKGTALTIAEENQFIKLVFKSGCAAEVKSALIFLLYTGLRRSELASATIDNNFVTVVCAKTRKGFQDKRRIIPITPMLRKWLPQIDIEKIKAVQPDALTQALKRLMPNHHLHELRHTFITRCQECGVPREVVSVWAGHAADNTQTSNVYTHFSPEYMLKEADKVIYNLE